MNEQRDEGTEWRVARVAALETLFGTADDEESHALVPFDLGPVAGGAADVIQFRNTVPGVLSVTSELIGRDNQVQNSLGNYELGICHRTPDPWGPGIISRLAYYTLESLLNPGDTMDVKPAAPRGSTISALLFYDFGRITVRGRAAGVLLCVGITREELAACRAGDRESVEKALASGNVYPFTDLRRRSVFAPTKKKWWFF